MKKIIFIAFLILCAKASVAQNHFQGTYYLDLAVGLNDQTSVQPSFGGGYNFNDKLSLNGRYSFSTTSNEDRYRFFEHSLDIFAKYAVLNLDEVASLNLLGGFSQSINRYSDIAVPSFTPKTYNMGYIAGAEAELFLSNNIAVFGAVYNRGYFLDKTHLEMAYQIGARVDLSIFKKQIIRRR